MKFGNNLRRCRFDHDEISQEALAMAIGVSRQTILSIEKGRFVPSTLLALKLAKFFNKSVEDIFFIIDDDDTKSSQKYLTHH
ncbi:MAG: helix-turn-helix transcriptional regulator [bacterium]